MCFEKEGGGLDGRCSQRTCRHAKRGGGEERWKGVGRGGGRKAVAATVVAECNFFSLVLDTPRRLMYHIFMPRAVRKCCIRQKDTKSDMCSNLVQFLRGA